MSGLKEFLESSTIHGLTYISTTRKYIRLFWIFVVIVGFSGAGYMISESFKAWDASPIKTLPISEITFPKITVCPSKNTYTDLNYDLMRIENMALDDDTRDKLLEYAEGLIWDPQVLLDDMMTNMNKLQVSDRFYNWYHGYTRIDVWPHKTTVCPSRYAAALASAVAGAFGKAVVPKPMPNGSCQRAVLKTSALNGTISTQYFGEKFDAHKVDAAIEYDIAIYPSDAIRKNADVTLNINIEKILMKHLSRGQEDTLIMTSLPYFGVKLRPKVNLR